MPEALAHAFDADRPACSTGTLADTADLRELASPADTPARADGRRIRMGGPQTIAAPADLPALASPTDIRVRANTSGVRVRANTSGVRTLAGAADIRMLARAVGIRLPAGPADTPALADGRRVHMVRLRTIAVPVAIAVPDAVFGVQSAREGLHPAVQRRAGERAALVHQGEAVRPAGGGAVTTNSPVPHRYRGCTGPNPA